MNFKTETVRLHNAVRKSNPQSKALRSELMDELNRKRAWVQSATALEFRD